MIIDNNCSEFVSVLASKEPTPGGGGAAAFVGAIGTALGNMVGSLTIGKKKYAYVESEIKELMIKAKKLENKLLSLVDDDAKAFIPLAKAYGMPKSTPEEIAEKDRVMEEALKAACEVPIEIMRACAEGIDLCSEFASKGNKLALSDAGCGAIICKAALKAASLNVYINTKSMKNVDLAQKFEKEADLLIEEYSVKADTVFEKVNDAIRA